MSETTDALEEASPHGPKPNLLTTWSPRMSDPILDATPTTTLATRERSSTLLVPAMSLEQALTRLAEFQRFCHEYLIESADGGQDGGDYGVIPGTKKKTLLKSGAEKLCEIYALADEYVMVKEIENWESGLFAYTLKCVLKSRRDDSLVGEGLGSCSTFESKYRWRDAQRLCPQCGVAAIIAGKAEYGGGWLCWRKKSGCNAKFAIDDPAITSQVVGRVENPDIIDTRNTALKIAKKRAKIDAVIGVTRSSGIFTQDLEDLTADAPSKPAAPTVNEIRAVAEGGDKVGKLPQNSRPDATPEPRAADATTISEAQRKKMFAVARSKGWKDTELQLCLKELWNYESTLQIRRDTFDTILEQVSAEDAAAKFRLLRSEAF